VELRAVLRAEEREERRVMELGCMATVIRARGRTGQSRQRLPGGGRGRRRAAGSAGLITWLTGHGGEDRTGVLRWKTRVGIGGAWLSMTQREGQISHFWMED
jgi:hypothetical protein